MVKEVVIHNKIFVGNLSYETTPNEIETLFSEVGQVIDVFMPSDRNTGRPRGFAFVEFAEGSSAAEAIEKFHGYQLNDRALRVNEAEQRPARSPQFSDRGPSSFQKPKGGKAKGSRRNIRSRKRGF